MNKRNNKWKMKKNKLKKLRKNKKENMRIKLNKKKVN